MKVVLTGHNGFIGSRMLASLAAYLEPKDTLVICDSNPKLSDTLQDYLDCIKTPKIVKQGKIQSIRTTRSDYHDEVNDWVDNTVREADIVYHLGEYSSVNCTRDQALDNLDNSITLYEACKRMNVKKFVYTSTCAVFGDQPSDIIGHNDYSDHTPKSHYAWAKSSFEKYMRLDELKSDMIIRCPRLSNVFGQGDNRGICYILSSLLSLESPDEFEVKCKLDSTRDYIHINAVIDELMCYINEVLLFPKQALYNVCSGSFYTLEEVIEIAEQAFNKELKKSKEPKINPYNEVLYTNIEPSSYMLKPNIPYPTLADYFAEEEAWYAANESITLPLEAESTWMENNE